MNYSGERFDRIQQLALELTEADRCAGRQAPAYGYSKANIELATKLVETKKGECP